MNPLILKSLCEILPMPLLIRFVVQMLPQTSSSLQLDAGVYCSQILGLYFLAQERIHFLHSL